MIIGDFNHTMDIWINELEQYSFEQLCKKPSPHSWSLGQLCNHLINDTNFYIEQIKICVASNEHSAEQSSPEAKEMFRNNEFPNVALEGSPNNAYIKQPDSKDHLIKDLLNLKFEMNKFAEIISKSPLNGKTKHPGLNYFSGMEWLQFADMHFRHHLRQKKRIDDFLNGGR